MDNIYDNNAADQAGLDEQDELESSDDSGSEEEEEESWIECFCRSKGNEFYCEVDRDFIEDDFNLTGLQGEVQKYRKTLDVILDNNEDSEDNDGM